MALLFGITALVYRSQGGFHGDPPAIFFVVLALEVAAVAGALTGFMPQRHLTRPGHRSVFLSGILGCFGAIAGLLLWVVTTDHAAASFTVVMLVLLAASFPTIAFIGRRAGVWTQGIAIAVGLLPFAWLIELFSQIALVGLPELAILIAITITAFQNR